MRERYFNLFTYLKQKVLLYNYLNSCSFGIMAVSTMELDLFVLLHFFFFEQILDNSCAYVVGGDVYFSVDSFPEYGELSGRKLDDNRAGERVAVDERKRNPADFALWKVQCPKC